MKRTTIGGNKSMGRGIGIGIVTSLAISICLVLLMTNLVSNQKIIDENVGITLFVIRIMAVLLGTMVGTRFLNEKKFIAIAAIVLGYIVILLCVGMLVYKGAFQKIGSGVLSVLIGGAITAGIACKLQTKPKRPVKFKG